MNLIIQAAKYAEKCHTGQMRKYPGTPYILHPLRVASRTMLLPDVRDTDVAAAVLHDSIEDTGITAADIQRELGPACGLAVAERVMELTNVSKTEHPEYNRAQKKELDRQRLSRVSPMAQNIKILDRIDNLNEMETATEDFKKLYLEESEALLYVLNAALLELREELRNLCAVLTCKYC